MKVKWYNSLLIFLCLLPLLSLNAQQDKLLREIDSLIAENELLAAQHLIQKETNDPKSHFLGELVYPLGKTEFLQNPETNFEKALELYELVNSLNLNDSIVYEANLGMSLLHIDKGTAFKAKEFLIRAKHLAETLEDVHRKVESEYYLGELGLKMGDFEALIVHTDNALDLIRKNNVINFSLVPRIYNYKGALMHFNAEPDSANFYFEKAINAIDKTGKDPEQTDYLPGTIYGNWFMIKQSAGYFDDAMRFTLKSIHHYNSFLKKANNHPLTEKVHGNLTIAYRNLGSLYYDLGEKEKAKRIALLGYNHAKKHFLKNTVQYFGAALMVGESLLYNNDLDEAEYYLKEAKTSLASIPGDNFSYQANLYGVLGDLAYQKGDYNQASAYYERTTNAYKSSNQQGFSQNEVYTFINLAKSYANLEDYTKSKDIINSTLTKVVEQHGQDSFLANEVRTAKVKILYDEQDFIGTIELGNQILGSYQKRAFDNIVSESFFSPNQLNVLLHLTKAQYELDTVKTVKSLGKAIGIIDSAIVKIERKKSFVTNESDVNTLLENSRELFDFGKKVYRKMFEITGKEQYLRKIIELHESSIYNRIRARLNLSDNQLTPKNIREKENLLKTNINKFFETAKETQFQVDEWKSHLKAWQEYVSTLEQKYPEYYEMRYKNVLTALNDVQKNMDTLSTAIRYLFVEDDLLAFVITRDSLEMVSLSNPLSLDCIPSISDFRKNNDEVFECLSNLYQSLWKPIQDKIKTNHVIIFPDENLFNLSFELLTPQKIHSYKELATNSLLAEHTISYNYSLFLLDDHRNMLEFNEDFIAYAPTFDSNMKKAYEMAIDDSVNIDKTYLTLLPQPFNAAIADRFSKRYGGTSFLNQQASKSIFSKTANEHKIIHIGTHAESNNVNPELSRLVFAKNVSDSTLINDNYLYTYEIYNQNLNSNLAILTACETGKPSYQAGEGMISLAHAFNYAGSKSILTSLWQIDEQSSAEILDGFYGYLEAGLTKDEALKNAKLNYLKSAEGRTLHPQYWAGLILMGDPSPIELSKPFPWMWLLVGTIVLCLLFLFLKNKAPNHR